MSRPLSSNKAITGVIAAGTLVCAAGPMLDPTGISHFAIAVLPALTGLLGNLLMARAAGAIKGALTIFTDSAFPEYHKRAVKVLVDIRAAYLEGGCGDDAAFDAIPPAT